MAQGTTYGTPQTAIDAAPRAGRHARPDRITLYAALAIGLTFLLMFFYAYRQRILTGQVDFAQLYAGATLVGTGELYSVDANNAAIKRLTGVTMEGVTYSRLPFYAFLLQPLTWLPYRMALAAFVLINLAAVIMFIVQFARTSPELPVFVAFSIPLMAALAQGQDTPLLLFAAAASFVLAKERRDLAAGFVLSLCAIKFHLFTMFPVIVIVYKRWGILKGALAGGLLLLVLSFAGGGVTWPIQYLKLVSSGYLDPLPEGMPNLKPLLLSAPALEIPLAAAIACGFIVLSRKLRNFDLSFGLALVAGMLLSFHAYSQDGVLLLLSFAIVTSCSVYKPLRTAIALAVSPVAYLLLLARAPYSALVPLLYLAVLVLAYLSRQSNSASERLT
jgi:hypothetical protein